MKVAIMQPYLFPYLGHFKLINAVDFFGVADDAQFINRGWITRNKILIGEEAIMFNFSVKKSAHEKMIKK